MHLADELQMRFLVGMISLLVRFQAHETFGFIQRYDVSICTTSNYFSLDSLLYKTSTVYFFLLAFR